ncbi:hypothetical protein NUW58_g9191 [Xylaria curta]|uniref:Uncharacterized protein n=1 Tax=Xylaria curta TaxID=42375 RepID=A0ACC1N0W2_9PEZI|nr:hypothetical protein NUW58_g9191 [Xylaria curta]
MKKPAAPMMRIAIAGGGGFSALLANELSRSAHAVLVLSRIAHPEFEANYDCQVAVVDYHNLETLEFSLQGVDLVISTISGPEQLNLIDAARRARVRTFVPSEFEGALGHRPAPASDPFDNGSAAALGELRRWSTSRQYPMKYTVFSCGIFYERFAPGGLRTYNMGVTSRLPNQGDYLIDVGAARFVAAAVELGIDNWPREFRMRGARITPQRIQFFCSEVRQVEFDVIDRPYSDILAWLDYYQQRNDEERWFAMQQLLQTADGRYTFGEANLNDLVDVQPISFREWLYNTWAPDQ